MLLSRFLNLMPFCESKSFDNATYGHGNPREDAYCFSKQGFIHPFVISNIMILILWAVANEQVASSRLAGTRGGRTRVFNNKMVRDSNLIQMNQHEVHPMLCRERPQGCSLYPMTQEHKQHAKLMTFFSRRLFDSLT